MSDYGNLCSVVKSISSIVLSFFLIVIFTFRTLPTSFETFRRIIFMFSFILYPVKNGFIDACLLIDWIFEVGFLMVKSKSCCFEVHSFPLDFCTKVSDKSVSLFHRLPCGCFFLMPFHGKGEVGFLTAVRERENLKPSTNLRCLLHIITMFDYHE